MRSFDALQAHLASAQPLRLSVAGANDDRVLAAIAEGIKTGRVAHASLVGPRGAINRILDDSIADRCTLIDAEDGAEMARHAVAQIRNGGADVLVKGSVDSPAYLRAVVDRENGLRESVLSNITVAEMSSVNRLIGGTDNGIIVAPNLEQKAAIARNAIRLFRGMGLDRVKIAAIAASEKPSAQQPASMDALALRDMEFEGGIVDGPYGYDVALSPQAAAAKKLSSAVAGMADVILFPSLEAGNATVKAWKLHGQARTASIVLGARVPILLNSRADGAEQRFLGLLLAQAVLAAKP